MGIKETITNTDTAKDTNTDIEIITKIINNPIILKKLKLKFNFKPKSNRKLIPRLSRLYLKKSRSTQISRSTQNSRSTQISISKSRAKSRAKSRSKSKGIVSKGGAAMNEDVNLGMDIDRIQISFRAGQNPAGAGATKTAHESAQHNGVTVPLELDNENSVVLRELDLIFLTANIVEGQNMVNETQIYKAMRNYVNEDGANLELAPVVSKVYVYQKMACFLVKKCIIMDTVGRIVGSAVGINERLLTLSRMGYGHFDIKPGNLAMDIPTRRIHFIDFDPKFFYPIRIVDDFDFAFYCMRIQFWGYTRLYHIGAFVPQLIFPQGPGHKQEFCRRLQLMDLAAIRGFINEDEQEPDPDPNKQQIKNIIRASYLRELQSPLYMLVHYLDTVVGQPIVYDYTLGFITPFVDRILALCEGR
jgi:hypothetical protein